MSEKVVFKSEALKFMDRKTVDDIFKNDGLLQAYKKNGRWVADQRKYENWLFKSLLSMRWTAPQLMKHFGWSYKKAVNNIKALGGECTNEVWEGLKTHKYWHIDKELWVKNFHEWQENPDKFPSFKM